MIRVVPKLTGRALIALACAAALTGIAGCGGGNGSDTGSARDAAQAYVDATNKGDYAQVCELLAAGYKQQLKIAANCPDFLKEQTSGAPRTTLTLVGVQEQGDHATAHIRSRSADVAGGAIANETATFTKQSDGSWRLTGLGGGAGA
jgi:predicted lipid-binding transport protein (Tim44 family)